MGDKRVEKFIHSIESKPRAFKDVHDLFFAVTVNLISDDSDNLLNGKKLRNGLVSAIDEAIRGMKQEAKDERKRTRAEKM